MTMKMKKEKKEKEKEKEKEKKKKRKKKKKKKKKEKKKNKQIDIRRKTYESKNISRIFFRNRATTISAPVIWKVLRDNWDFGSLGHRGDLVFNCFLLIFFLS